MPDNRSEKSRYPSRFGKSRWVTAAQYLAELMCERRARQEKRTLPPSFWNDQHWAAVYRQQVAAATRLIKRLDPEDAGTGAAAVSAFLRSERGKTCYSLMGAWVVPHVEALHRAVALRAECRQEQPPAPPETPTAPVGPREAFVGRSSVLQKLKGLEDG